MNEWYPIPTQYVRQGAADVIRNLKQYLRNPSDATLSVLTPPSDFDSVSLIGNDLNWTFGSAGQGTTLIVEAEWTVDGSTETAQAIIDFKVSAEGEADILEWYWFPTVDIFTDATGAFSGTAVPDVDDNLNNPSGASVVIQLVSHSTSIASASINADNDVQISVSGLTANASGFVIVSATATIDGIVRTIQQQIDMRLVFNTVDLSGYVTDGAITEFVTAADVTSGIGDLYATDTELANATSGLTTDADLTIRNLSGLATDADLTSATSGLPTDADLTTATSRLSQQMLT